MLFIPLLKCECPTQMCMLLHVVGEESQSKSGYKTSLRTKEKEQESMGMGPHQLFASSCR